MKGATFRDDKMSTYYEEVHWLEERFKNFELHHML